MDNDASSGRTWDDLLVTSEARLRRAQRVARLGSWELDLRTRVMWGSDEAFRIYGLELTPDSSLPYDVVKQIPLPEYRPALDHALAGLVRDGTPYEIRFRIRRHDDGAVRHVHSFAEVSRDVSGRPTVITGTIQDVTEHEEASQALQEALRANEERARLILEQAADAIFLSTPDSGFSQVNAQACELTGYDRQELLGRSAPLLFAPEVLAATPLRQDLLDRGETVIRERMLTRKDGSRVLVEMRSKRLPDGTHQSIVRDISERRRLEEQLFLRQRMDSLGTLAGGIAHDFNNILAAIVGYADALRLSGALVEADQKEKVDGILQCSQRAADLVRGLLMLTRPDQSETATFDLHTVASEAFRVLGETTDRIIDKEVLIPPGRFPISGNASALYRALMNLGINAVQAIEQKGPRLGDRVSIDACEYLAREDDPLPLAPGPYVHVLLRDTGLGMPPEVQEQAFDLLFTTKDKGERKGQGLGLAVVYNVVVRQHRGLVEIESAEGGGSTFHLYLPRGTRTEVSRSPSAPAIRGGSETILLVEDEVEVADITRQALERVGYSVLLAADGREGVEVFRRHLDDVDLVILDRTLPRLQGEEVLREMLALRPGLKVIVSSGDAAVELSTFAGAQRLLNKPYGLAVLYEAIREALDRDREVEGR